MNKITTKKQKDGFDRSLDYDLLERKLLLNLKKKYLELKVNPSIQKVKAISNIAIAILQLKNGSRISEAVESMEIFCNDLNLKSVEVKISKRKDGAMREIILPNEIKKDMLVYINNYKVLDFTKKLQIQNKVRDYLNKHYESNTHSLRYATVTKLVDIGTPLNIVSKTLGHKNLSQILTYTQNKQVKNVLLTLSNRKDLK